MAITKSNGLITSWDPSPNSSIQSIELNGTNAYVGGSFTTIGGQPRNYIAEIILSTGSATTWNPNANSPVGTIKLVGTTIYAGGSFTTIGGQNRNYLAALNNTNGNATSWDPKSNGQVNRIYQAGSDIFAIGSFTFMNSEQRTNLLAISKSNGLITSWSPNPNSTIETMALNGANAYVGGSFTAIGGQPRNFIAEISLSTGNATTWNPNANATVNAIKRFGNNVYVGGGFTTIGGQNRNRLAALNNTNGNATTWNPNANSTVVKLNVSDSILYVAGSFTNISGQNRNRLASFKLPNENITSWNPDVSGPVYDLFVTGSSVYIGGSFNQVSGQSRNNLASFGKQTGNLRSWNPNITGGSVHSVTAKGKNVFIGGNFTKAGSQACNRFAVINANSGIPDLYFPNVNSQINTLSAYDSLIFLGGSFSAINGFNYGGLASIAYQNAFFKPEIEDFNSKEGGNLGEVTVVIHGNGFEDGTKVKLTRNGQSDIPLQNLYASDGIQITGVFNLNGAAIGNWNLVVQIPGDTTMTIPNGFAVKQGVAPQPWTSIVGFDRIRIGQWQSYNLVYGNSGNVDAHGVPIWFTVSNNAELDLKFEIQKNYKYFNVPYNALYDSIPKFYVADTVLDVIGSVKLVGLYIPTIQANSTNNLTFKIKLNSPGQINMMSWADEPYFGSPLKPFVSECYDALFDLALSQNPVTNCLNNSFNTGYRAGEFLNQAISGEVARGIGGIVFAMPAIITTNLLDCAFGFAPSEILTKTGKIIKKLNESFLSRSSGGSGIPIPGLDAMKSCLPPKNPPQKTPPVQTINSFDPNDKLGPIGEGNANFINVSNRVLPYIIRCENIDTASAAAQTVLIIDTLDRSVFDLSSFQLGFFSIADSIIPIPQGLKNYETDIDLRPANNIIARVTANLNMQTGVARWEFTSLDPLTLEPTINPVAGFLPPNVKKPEGEAAVMYSIKTLNSIPNGVKIKNKAYIYFDSNPAIITNEWTNTSDIIKPISKINALPPVQYNDSTIRISWTRSDIGSGVRSYAIYYSVNGGQFKVLTPYIADTSLLFVGRMDSAYAFFSIATDSVGNIENMKTTAEARTSFSIVTSINNGVQAEKMKVSIYPNPNQGNFNLSINTSKTGTYEVSIADIFGRTIYRQKEILSFGDNVLPLIVKKSGTYLITISNKRDRIVKKVVITK